MRKCKYCNNKGSCTAIKSLVWLLKWGLFFVAGDYSRRTYIARYIANICPFYREG